MLFRSATGNYYLRQAYVYGRVSETDEWTEIGAVTNNNSEIDKVGLWNENAADNDKRNIYSINLTGGNYRYVKVEMIAKTQIYLSEMYIFNKEVKEEEEYKNLNVISNNEKLTGGWYNDNGYVLTYSNNTADYLWVNDNPNELGGTAAVSISDEQDVFGDTIVQSGDSVASRPDLQDGGIGAGDRKSVV